MDLTHTILTAIVIFCLASKDTRWISIIILTLMSYLYPVSVVTLALIFMCIYSFREKGR